jgi:hypothetical protein
MEAAERAKEAKQAEADERFRRAVELLQASENSIIQEIRARFADALSLVLDLLMEVSNRHCETNFRRLVFEDDDTPPKKRSGIYRYMATVKELLAGADARSESKEIFEMFDGLVDWIKDPIFFIGDPPYSYEDMDEYEREELILHLREGNRLLLTLMRVMPRRRSTAAEDWSDDNSEGGSETRVMRRSEEEARMAEEPIDLSEEVFSSRHVARENPVPFSTQEDGPQPSTQVRTQDLNEWDGEAQALNQPWLEEPNNTDGMAQVDIHSDAENSEESDSLDDTISYRLSGYNDFAVNCLEATKTLEDEVS